MLAGLLPAKGMSRPPAGPPPVLAALAAGVGAFAVYAPTLNSITAGDSGELLNAAANWSVAHPPGYPLWTLLVGGLLRLPGLPAPEDSATRAAVLSLFSASGALFFLVLSALSLPALFRPAGAAAAASSAWPAPGTVAGAVGVAWLFGTSKTAWRYAVQAEVFALNNLLVSALAWATVHFANRKGLPRALIISFCSGLCLCNQHTSVFYIIPIALWTMLSGGWALWRPRSLALLSVAALTGLSPYLYLPVASQWKHVHAWGDQTNVAGFVKHFLRQEYGTFQLANSQAEDVSLSMRVQDIMHLFFETFRRDSPIGATLCMVGVAHFLLVLAQFAAGALSGGEGEEEEEVSEDESVDEISIEWEEEDGEEEEPSAASTGGSGSRRPSTSSEQGPASGGGRLEIAPRGVEVRALLLFSLVLYLGIFTYLSNVEINQGILHGVYRRFWAQALLVLYVPFAYDGLMALFGAAAAVYTAGQRGAVKAELHASAILGFGVMFLSLVLGQALKEREYQVKAVSYSHVARIYSYSFVNYLPEQDPATPNVIWPYKGDAHSYLGFYVSTVHPMRGDVQMPCSFDFGNMAMMNDTTWFQRVYPGVHLPRKTIGPWPQASLPLPNPEQGIPKPFSFMEFWKANGGEDGRVFSVGLLAPEGMGIASFDPEMEYVRGKDPLATLSKWPGYGFATMIMPASFDDLEANSPMFYLKYIALTTTGLTELLRDLLEEVRKAPTLWMTKAEGAPPREPATHEHWEASFPINAMEIFFDMAGKYVDIVRNYAKIQEKVKSEEYEGEWSPQAGALVVASATNGLKEAYDLVAEFGVLQVHQDSYELRMAEIAQVLVTLAAAVPHVQPPPPPEA